MTRRITMRRITASLAAAFILGASALLPGCASDHGGSIATPNGVQYTVVVRNDSNHAVDVAWIVAFRRNDSGDLGKPLEHTLGVIAPNTTGRDGPSVIGMQPDRASEFTQVFRLRLTIPSASWQEPARMWWEVVGTLPESFVIENGPGPDGFLVKLRAQGAAVEAVPRQFWTDEDQ